MLVLSNPTQLYFVYKVVIDWGDCMKFKKAIIWILIAINLFVFVGCRDTNIKRNKVDKQVINSNNEFGLNLFKSISNEEKYENVVISPISINTALTMMYNGADGNTKEEMKDVLKYNNLDMEKVNETFSELLRYLKIDDNNIDLNIVNSIWVNKNNTINDNFINLNKKTYKSQFNKVDFQDKGSVDKINQWISKETKGNINKMLEPPISDNIIMYVINAVYFKGKWQEPFDKNNNVEDEFINELGEKNICKFMKRSGFDTETCYFKGNDFEGIKLSYSGCTKAMYVMLPNKESNLQQFIKNLTFDKIVNMINEINNNEENIDVFIPKFDIEYESKELKNVLMKLGMVDAFEEGANFSKITNDLFIDDVLHKAKIQVDEEGTVASAATVIATKETAMEMEIKEFKANRPFLFFISDEESGIILFMGKLTDI